MAARVSADGSIESSALSCCGAKEHDASGFFSQLTGDNWRPREIQRCMVPVRPESGHFVETQSDRIPTRHAACNSHS